MNKGRLVVGSSSWWAEPRPHPTLPRTHSGERLCAGRSGLAAWPLGAIQAPRVKIFLGGRRSVEGLWVLHGGVGAQPGQAQRVAGGSTGSPPRKQAQRSCGVLFAWLLRAAGSSPLVRIPGIGGGGGWTGIEGETKAATHRCHSVGQIPGLVHCLCLYQQCQSNSSKAPSSRQPVLIHTPTGQGPHFMVSP